MVTPELNTEMRVEADASEYEDEKWRLVAHISKLLNEAKRNYEIHNKAMLAIIRYSEAWRHFLEEAKGQFEIWMDYKTWSTL